MTAPTMCKRRDARKWGLLAVVLAATCTGCAPYKWIYDDYEQAEKLAREKSKHLFVYYRWWMSPECGVVERDVLEKPPIQKLFRNSVNCWLNQDWPANQEVMGGFGVDTVPAFVIVTPDGTPHKRTGTPTEEHFKRFVLKAMPEATAPKKKPPPKTTSAPRPTPTADPQANAERRP